MVYLFIGEGSASKDVKLKALRQEILSGNTESFNLDVVYAQELTRKELQEKLIYLPVKNARRLLVIKEAQNLKEDVKDFILQYVQKPSKHVSLVIDVSPRGKPPGFVNQLQRFVQVIRFQETRQPDTFTLGRSIELGKLDTALRLLNQLLKNGERPERILGGLRYTWEKDRGTPVELRRKLRLLLNCDIDIKTGRLKPAFALEKLVIGLSSPGKLSR